MGQQDREGPGGLWRWPFVEQVTFCCQDSRDVPVSSEETHSWLSGTRQMPGEKRGTWEGRSRPRMTGREHGGLERAGHGRELVTPEGTQ